MFRRLATRRAGFTLMEALVVIAIIGIVAAILVPTISKARMRARMIECTNNLMQIGLALQMYLDDQGERYPIWPDPEDPDPDLFEFTRPDGTPYLLEATYVVQWSSIDSPDLVNEKIGLGCLYPDFLRDERVLNEPGGINPMVFDALIDEERNIAANETVESGYFFVNGDFEVEGTKGPIGLNWQHFRTTEPVVWCAQVYDPDPDPTKEIRRFVHNRKEINCLYMDGHVDRIEVPEGRPDEFIVRPDATPEWTVRDVIRSIKEVSGTHNQEDYPQ